MEKGDNDAYLYHLGDVGDECTWQLHTPHVTETLHCNEIRKIIDIIYKFTQHFSMKNKTLPISQLGCLLNRCRNSHNNKHAVSQVPLSKS
jgi:hypothetical protein